MKNSIFLLLPLCGSIIFMIIANILHKNGDKGGAFLTGFGSTAIIALLAILMFDIKEVSLIATVILAIAAVAAFCATLEAHLTIGSIMIDEEKKKITFYGVTSVIYYVFIIIGSAMFFL